MDTSGQLPRAYFQTLQNDWTEGDEGPVLPEPGKLNGMAASTMLHEKQTVTARLCH